MTRVQRVTDKWVDHPSSDWAITVLVLVVVVAVDPRGFVLASSRATLYQTLAGVSGVLLTLGSLVVTLLFTVTPSERLEVVLRQVGQRLRLLVMSSLTALVATTLAFVLLFVLDTSSRGWRLAAVSVAGSMMLLRFGRLWWLLGRVLQVMATADASTESGPPAAAERVWERPAVGAEHYQLKRRTNPRRR